MRILGIFLSSTLILGCTGEVSLVGDPDGVRGPQPDIVIEPAALEFPNLTEGETATLPFTVRNEGEAELDVTAVEVVVGEASFSVAGPQVFSLGIDQSRTFEVTFTPTQQDENLGRIEVVSDDPDEARAPVDLLGLGTVPDLEITPRNFEFGEAFVPCGDELNVKLENVGSDDIVITNLRYTSGDGDLFINNVEDVREDLPITLEPGENRFIRVDWRPSSNAGDQGTLIVTSNDPVGEETAQQQGTGVYVGSTTETFTESGVPPVDLLFLIDQSCSMESDNEATLSAGISEFFGKLRELSDWQLIQVNGPTACANGGIFDGATPGAESSFRNTAFSPNGYIPETLSESLFELAQMALDQTGPNDCNAGFVRPGSLLHIIVASDEQEQSGTSWQTHVANFEQFVADPDLLRVSAIVDIYTQCSDNPSTWGPGGYLEASQATNGASLDICESTWGDDLPDLAEDVLEGVRSYNLANRAVEASIQVTVNGTPTTSFAYSDEARTVTVLDPPISGGDTVSISYAIAANCGQ
ncbi:MAG: choice-of-anchor D domain-containing protein [Myxococcota bacterium]